MLLLPVFIETLAPFIRISAYRARVLGHALLEHLSVPSRIDLGVVVTFRFLRTGRRVEHTRRVHHHGGRRWRRRSQLTRRQELPPQTTTTRTLEHIHSLKLRHGCLGIGFERFIKLLLLLLLLLFATRRLVTSLFAAQLR